MPAGRGRPPAPSGRVRRREIRPRFAVLVVLAAVLLPLAAPALAEYLGPDRTVVEEVVVRDPDHDIWTLTHVDLFDGYSDVCLVMHTCEEHPSVERQAALCGWVADTSGCEEAFQTERRTATLPEAAVSADLRGCSLHGGWCPAESVLHLLGAEPLAGYEITGIEGTRNSEAFFCAGAQCDVTALEGENNFTFWALSSYGDSSLMGTLSARVDTTPPTIAFLEPLAGATVAVAGKITLRGVSADSVSGLAAVELSRDGGASWISLSFDPDGRWSLEWDTRTEPEGARLVIARARDNAGHPSAPSQVSLQLDRTPPRVRVPDTWPIWEEARLEVADSGSGVARVVVTIDGGRYGSRRWEYRATAARPPRTIAWDRRFEDIVAPIGEYPVTVEAWDWAGNRGVDEGLLRIPDPGVSPTPIRPASPEKEAEPPTDDIAVGPAMLPPRPVMVEPVDLPHKKEKDPRTAVEEEAFPLWGPVALAAVAIASAEVLRRRRERELRETARVEALRRGAAAAAAPGALASRLARLRARAEKAVAPIRAAMRSARLLGRETQPAAGPGEGSSHQGDAWQQIELLPARQWAAAASAAPRPAQPFLEPLRFLREHAPSARQVLRGLGVYNLVQAARHVAVRRVADTLRVAGPRLDRMRLGLREMVNRVRPENVRLISQSPFGRAVQSLKSWGVAFGLGLNLASDTADYLEGKSNRFEYAAALTIDTGITIAAALVAGAVAGFGTGALVGAGLGTVAIPIPGVGTLAGASLAGVAGAILGIGVVAVCVGYVYSSGARDFVVQQVSNFYRGWTEPAAELRERNR